MQVDASLLAMWIKRRSVWWALFLPSTIFLFWGNSLLPFFCYVPSLQFDWGH
jgi:hypothetical protein